MSARSAPDVSGAHPRAAFRARVALLLLAGSALLLAPWWGPRALRPLAFFRVRKVEILGARYTPPAEVLERLHVDTNRSVWDPLGPLAARVRRHPQVERVRVRRRLPGTLVVELVERTPVALVALGDDLRTVDDSGRVLPLDPSRTPVDLPIVHASPRDTAVFHLLGAMQRSDPRLYARLTSVRLTGRGEMLLLVDDLPVRALTTVTLARLSDIALVERDLARRRVRPTELDLRYRDQVIARLP